MLVILIIEIASMKNDSLSYTGEKKEEIIINLESANITEETEEIKFTITNNRESDAFEFSPWFGLQKMVNGKWENLEFIYNENDSEGIGYAFEDFLGYIVNDGKPRKEKLPLKLWYGDLSVGEYRIVVKENSEDDIDKSYYAIFYIH